MFWDMRHRRYFAGKREFTTGTPSSASLPYDRTLTNRYAPLNPKIRLGAQAAIAGVS